MKNTLTFVLLISAFGGLSAPAFAQICSPTVLNPTTPAVTTLTGRGVYISGGKAYVVSYDFGLRIVDINDPANPVTLNPTFIPGDNMYTTQTGLGVYVSGDYAYVVSDTYGLQIVDISGCGCPPSVFYSLQVNVAGNGSVTSTPSGINNCTSISISVDCEEDYLAGTVVTLTATPDSGSGFVGWSGDCSGTNATTQVLMNAAKTCTATFVQAGVELTKTGPSIVQRGDTFDYTLEYQNTGAIELTNVVIEDTLPAGVIFVSASDGGTETTGTVTWNLVTLPVGTTRRVTLTVGTSCLTPSEMLNDNYSIRSTETGVVQGSPAVITTFGSSSTAPVTVSITSIPERTPLRSGDLVTHTITLTNTIDKWRCNLRMSLSSGSVMVFETLVSDGGGTVTMQDGNNWKWRGPIGPNGTSAIVFTTRVEDCLYTRFEDRLGSITVYNSEGKQVGYGWPPALPLERPIAVSFTALNLGPAQNSFIRTNRQYQVARPGTSIDFQITLTNQFAADQPNVTIDLPIPAGLTPVGDPPFIPPTDPAATYDSSTSTISWAGPIAGNQTITITFRAELDAGASCRVELPLAGATGTCDDIESTLSILIVPEPPSAPYLIGIDWMQGLYTWKPGADSGFQELLCLPGEMYFGMGQATNGDLWVAGVPTFRFNPNTLDFEIFSEDFVEALGPEGGPSDVAFDLTTGTVVFLERNFGATPGLAIKRYDPITQQLTEILDGLPKMDRIVVDIDGMIAGLAQTGLIRIDPADPNNYQTFADPNFVDTIGSVNTRILSLDNDGNYLIQANDYYSTPQSLVKIDRLTGTFTEIVPDLSVLLPGIQSSMLRSSAVGTAGEIFLGTYPENDIAQIELTPTLSGQFLAALGTRPPSPSFTILSDMEYIGSMFDFHHFARFAEHWLQEDCSELNNWCEGADLYKDVYNVVNILDLKVFIDYWATRAGR